MEKQRPPVNSANLVVVLRNRAGVLSLAAVAKLVVLNGGHYGERRTRKLPLECRISSSQSVHHSLDFHNFLSLKWMARLHRV